MNAAATTLLSSLTAWQVGSSPRCDTVPRRPREESSSFTAAESLVQSRTRPSGAEVTTSTEVDVTSGSCTLMWLNSESWQSTSLKNSVGMIHSGFNLCSSSHLASRRNSLV